MDPITDPDQFVRIKDPKNPGEALVLARRDFNASTHELFDAPSAAKTSEPPAPPAPPPPGIDARCDVTSMTVKDAANVIADAPLEQLDSYEHIERTTPNKKGEVGGRKGVLTAIAERRAQLTTPAQ